MKPSEFDWGIGVVTFWDLDELDVSKPIRDQIEILKEDLIQVRFRENIVLDVGWYPSFSRRGRFVVEVVKDCDWESPVCRYEATDASSLLSCLEKATGVASATT